MMSTPAQGQSEGAAGPLNSIAGSEGYKDAEIVIALLCRRIEWPSVAYVLAHCLSFVDAQSLAKYNISEPLRVCTASIQNFGARCNGAPAQQLEHIEEPDGPVPAGGWCAAGEDFCGYDIDAWRCGFLLALGFASVEFSHQF